MARKGLFGKLAEAGRSWLKRTFGGSRVNEEASRQAEGQRRIEQEAAERAAREEASRRAAQAEREANELNQMRERFQPIIDEANSRAGAILNQGLTSAALLRAEQESGRGYFTLDLADTKQELIEEATRARVFLADETSTIEGAKIYTAQMNAAEFRGKFGNQYHTWEHKFKNFDTSVIDEETAKVVFSNYRKLEELRAADITGDGAYGSENLIIAMYDAQVRGEDSFMVGLEQLDAYYRKKTTEWKSRFERANQVSDILGTYVDYDDIGGLFF